MSRAEWYAREIPADASDEQIIDAGVAFVMSDFGDDIGPGTEEEVAAGFVRLRETVAWLEALALTTNPPVSGREPLMGAD